MDLLALFTNVCTAICDPLLGWMLRLPTDAMLIVLALLTSVLMTVIRKYSSDQPLLARIDADKARLKTLTRTAKQAGDRDALARFKVLSTRHAIKAIGQEGGPLLWSIVPIAILATWAFERVDMIPPKAGEPITVHVLTKPTAAGGLAHLVAGDGVQSSAPVQVLVTGEAWGQPCAQATFTINANAGERELIVRTEHESVSVPLRIGASTYAPVLTSVGETTVRVDLHQRKLFGIVPGIDAIGFAPWLVGYLVLVIPMVFLIRPLLRTR